MGSNVSVSPSSEFCRSQKFRERNSAPIQDFSFDLSVRAQKERRWNGKAKRLGGLHVDHEFEGRRSLDRNVGGFGAFEDLVYENGGAAIERDIVRAIAEESPRVGILDEADRGEALLDR